MSAPVRRRPEQLADLAGELLETLRSVVWLPTWWGSTSARPTIEKARALIVKADAIATAMPVATPTATDMTIGTGRRG